MGFAEADALRALMSKVMSGLAKTVQCWSLMLTLRFRVQKSMALATELLLEQASRKEQNPPARSMTERRPQGLGTAPAGVPATAPAAAVDAAGSYLHVDSDVDALLSSGQWETVQVVDISAHHASKKVNRWFKAHRRTAIRRA